MIFGTHIVLYSNDAEGDRSFFRDVLNMQSVDAGGGWLIFRLPPSELAVHPGNAAAGSMLKGELYLMCDDLSAAMAMLGEKGVHCSAITHAPWGAVTTVSLPGGGSIGLYQPAHPMAVARG